MRLKELQPQFIKIISTSTTRDVDDIIGADGIEFLCPKCINDSGHSILCWQPHVDPNLDPKPGRWNLVGTGCDDLSLVNGSSSVLLNGGCNAHFFIKNGEIKMCN